MQGVVGENEGKTRLRPRHGCGD